MRKSAAAREFDKAGMVIKYNERILSIDLESKIYGIMLNYCDLTSHSKRNAFC